MSCIKCNSLLALLRQMEHLVADIPSSDSKDELGVDLMTARVDILSWMFHIIRGVQQDKSKKFYISTRFKKWSSVIGLVDEEVTRKSIERRWTASLERKEFPPH